MYELPIRTQIYLGLVTAVAIFVTGYAVSISTMPENERLYLAAGIAGLTALAWRFPLPLSFKTHLYLDTTMIIAAALLFQPGVAILSVAAGTLIGQLARRRLWDEGLFNISQTSLQVAVAALILRSAGWEPDAPEFSSPEFIFAIAVAGLVVFLVNNVLVGGIVSTQAGVNPIEIWLMSIVGGERFEYLGHLSQVGLGITAAVLADSDPWTVGLLLLPAGAIYSALQQGYRLRQQAEQALQHSEVSLAEAQRLAHVGSWDWNITTGTLSLSDELFRMLGVDRDEGEMSYDALIALAHPDDRLMVDEAIHHALHDGNSFDIEHRVLHYGREERILHHRGEVLFDERENKTRMIGTVHDITERKAFESRLEHQAYHDALTGLPNRSFVLERLAAMLDDEDGARENPAVLFVDLDSFKEVNDNYGHDASDRLLIEVAQRIEQSAGPDDTVGRLAGDEFIILMGNLADANSASSLAARICAEVGRPYEVQGDPVQVTASVGIALAEPRHEAAADILRDADRALYQAKALGKARYAVYDEPAVV